MRIGPLLGDGSGAGLALAAWVGLGDGDADFDGVGDAVDRCGLGDRAIVGRSVGSGVAGGCGGTLTRRLASLRVASSTTLAPGGRSRSSRDCSMRRSSAICAVLLGLLGDVAM